MPLYNLTKTADRALHRANHQAELTAIQEGTWPRDVNDLLRWEVPRGLYLGRTWTQQEWAAHMCQEALKGSYLVDLRLAAGDPELKKWEGWKDPEKGLLKVMLEFSKLLGDAHLLLHVHEPDAAVHRWGNSMLEDQEQLLFGRCMHIQTQKNEDVLLIIWAFKTQAAIPIRYLGMMRIGGVWGAEKILNPINTVTAQLLWGLYTK